MSIVLHQTLKELMKRKGVTARAVCRACVIPQSSYRDLLSGKSEPSVKYVPKLAEYFGVSIDFLLTGKESKTDNLNAFLTEEVFEGLLQVKIARVIKK